MHECELFFHTVSFIQLYFLLHTSPVAAPILSIITFVSSFTVCLHLSCMTYCSCENESFMHDVYLKSFCMFKRLAEVYVWVTYFWGIIFCTKTSVYFAVTISYLGASRSNCFCFVIYQSIKIRHTYKHHWKLPHLIYWIHFQILYPPWPVIKPVAVKTIQPASVHNQPFVLWHMQ